MFLRSLTLKGFKSFADKTTLEFVPGVSVIVGPNGSGKSNIVDAISWVLGEQGVRSLRGGQMADVIFAGSPKRPGLGMAEVQLVIDNEAGRIPVPMSELQISRAVYRSGESEYRIGGELRRLMDIQELLSDSGIGRALHTIVSQGQLDDVLTARPEDRRQFIEEAAGIAKHRRRKERAERKLVSLDQDLLRLQDVAAELRRQLKPLRQQAETAKKHEKYSAEAEELAWRIAAARLRGLLQTQRDRKPMWEQGIAAREGAKRRMEALDARIEELTARRAAVTEALAAADAELTRAQERRRVAEAALAPARAAEAEAARRLSAVEDSTYRLDGLRAEIEASSGQMDALATTLVEREADLERAEADFRAATEARRVAEEDRRRWSEEAAARRAEVDTIRRSLASYERERAGLAGQLGASRDRLAEAESRAEELQRRVEQLDARATGLADKRAALVDEHDRSSARVEELERALASHRTAAAVLAARRDDLADTPGSRLAAGADGRAAGPVRELIRPKRGWERALAAALGAHADAVVYADRPGALADAATAEGATLLAPIADQAARADLEAPRLLDEVVVDPRAARVASALLGHVLIAESLAAADAMVAQGGAQAAVTREGILVTATAIQTATSEGGRARELADDLEQVQREVAAAESALRPLRRRLSDLAGERTELDAAIADLDAQITTCSVELGQLDTSRAGLGREVELLEQRVAGLDESAAIWRDTLAGAPAEVPAPPELPLAPEPPVGARVAVETVRRERASMEAKLGQLRLDLDGLLAATPEQLRAEHERTRHALQQVEAEIDAAGAALAAAQAAQSAAAGEQRQATTDEADANTAWREAASELDRLRETYEDEDRARGDLERRIADAERLLREGHQMEPTDALAALADEDGVEELERRAELVSRRLAMLGRVNLLASDEFEALQGRYEFMERELDDVRKARRDLLEVIRRVDEEMVTLFDAAYRDVAGEFERMFAELFPGGEGRLVLTDPANPLATGIDIEARPGRKRVKRLSLLSGGERSLTALGFLFSIFKARPSPFYLLDEVEAALDDVNLHRFLGLIKDFSLHSQVLIVTHQKRTMEAAEMMYGVSMNQDGSSRVLCQKIHDPVPDTPAEVSQPQSVN